MILMILVMILNLIVTFESSSDFKQNQDAPVKENKEDNNNKKENLFQSYCILLI